MSRQLHFEFDKWREPLGPIPPDSRLEDDDGLPLTPEAIAFAERLASEVFGTTLEEWPPEEEKKGWTQRDEEMSFLRRHPK